MTALTRELRLLLVPARLARIGAGLATALLLLYVVLPHVLHTSHTASGHWETPFPFVALGTIIGLTYGLLAVGLVLVYRSNRLINFAHGQVGAFGAAFFGIEATSWHIPYWVAFLPALAVGGATGAIAEVAVVRRLRKAPAIMSVVATLGIAQFLVVLAFAISSTSAVGYPVPTGLPSFHIGALLVTPAYSGMLFLSPVVVIAVGLFLKLSRFGLAIRGAADNPEAARMAGIFASRMSSLAWAIAGAVATFGAILAQPGHGSFGTDSFGPHLLLIALTGAVLARMQSLPAAMVAGIAIGIGEQLVIANYQPPLVEAVLFVVILLSLLLQRQRVGRTEDKGSWAAVQAARPLPRAIRQVPSVRLLFPALAGVVLVGLVLLPQVIDNTDSGRMTTIFAFIVVGFSVSIITGLGGQLSLGQFALSAVGAVASIAVFKRTHDVYEAFAYAGLVAAAVSVLIGLPALRIKGLLLTVTTLSFALVVPDYLLQKSWMLGNGKDPGTISVFGQRLDTGHRYYYLALAVAVLALLITRNVREGALGRRLVAVRDNDDAARAFTVPAAVVKLQGFALAGFLAGLGGAMFVHSQALANSQQFPTSASLDVVKMAVIGGLGLLSGPIIGAIFVQGAIFLPLDSAGLAATAFGQLLVIMYVPGGLGSLVTPLRDRIANTLARRAGVDVAAAYNAERGFAETQRPEGLAPHLRSRRRRRAVAETGVLLSAVGLRKSFGGVRAVRGVSFDVRAGETLGLIGPNGAGKTTTFELLAGFTRSDEGTVHYAGTDITDLSPEARARLGMIRSFQDAALFPTLSVLECVELACERVEPTRLAPSLLGIRRSERRKRARAEELVAFMGLERYRGSQIQELSTGTRRITEIACLVALQPQLLLLDEPSSGVAQRETEALGALLQRLKDDLGLTLVIIEHDIPLIMGLSDRIVCMADGEVIAAGTPDVVRHDPAVVEAYLGGSLTAIERSAGAGARRPARTKTAAAARSKPTPKKPVPVSGRSS